MSLKINWDALGIVTSVACAIHCAVLPLVLTSLPVFGVDLVDNHGFEYLMLLLALVIGIAALWHGFKKHHQNGTPILLFTLGMILLVAKQTWHEWKIWLLVPAVAAIVLSHYRNYRLCREGRPCRSGDCTH